MRREAPALRLDGRREPSRGGDRRPHGLTASADLPSGRGARRLRPRREAPAGVFTACLTVAAWGMLGAAPPPRAAAEAWPPPATAAQRAPRVAATALAPAPIDPPAAPGSTFPALAAERPTGAGRGHDILLTWLAPGPSGGRLMFARLAGEAWSQPITVAEPVGAFDPADRPSLTAIDTQAVRRTLIARTGDLVARSGDGGRTWARLPSPGLPFASVAGGDEEAYVFWLDGAARGPARLLGTRLLAGQTLLDPRVAGGSGPAAAMTSEGPVVAYRDAGGDGKIAVVRRQGGRWTPPHPLDPTQPRRAGKASAGPHVAARRRQVAIAWTLESPRRQRLLVAFSADAGQTFGVPIELAARTGDALPFASLDVALDDDGHATVLWMAPAGPTAASLHLARLSPDGTHGEPFVLAEGLHPPLESPPQIARAGDRLVATWIEGAPTRVRVVSVPVAGIPAPGGRGALGLAGRATDATTSRGRPGEPAPDLELVSLDGDRVSLPSLRGRAVLLNLWATWCLPCVAEMPELAALHERHGAAGLTVVGVSVDGPDAVASVRRFVDALKVPFAVWLDPEMRLYGALRATGLPATWIIDRGGRILWRRDEAITADDPEVMRALGRAFGEPPGPP